MLALPGFVSGLFFDDQPAPFWPTTSRRARPVFFHGASHTHHESLGEFQNIRVQMKARVTGSPAGWRRPLWCSWRAGGCFRNRGKTSSLLRHFAGWLLAVLIAHGLLMFLAAAYSATAGNDDWKIAWWVRSILGTVGLFVLIAAVWWT